MYFLTYGRFLHYFDLAKIVEAYLEFLKQVLTAVRHGMILTYADRHLYWPRQRLSWLCYWERGWLWCVFCFGSTDGHAGGCTIFHSNRFSVTTTRRHKVVKIIRKKVKKENKMRKYKKGTQQKTN